MPKNDKRWMAFEELPEAAKPLALAYNAHFSPLHSTSNVVRLADGGDSPRFFVQHHGRRAAPSKSRLLPPAIVSL